MLYNTFLSGFAISCSFAMKPNVLVCSMRLRSRSSVTSFTAEVPKGGVEKVNFPGVNL